MVKVNKTKEDLNITLKLLNKPLTGSRNLYQVHLNFVFRNNQSKILYPLLLKLIFLWVEKEFVLSQDLQDSLYYSFMLLQDLDEDQDIVQIHYNNSLYDQISVHYCLESCQTVSYAKKHYKRPILVQKAAFHPSLCLIQTLLNPQQTSCFVKYLAP